MQRGEAENILRGFFANDAHGTSAVYLFGSVARGTNRAGSDVDIGVLLAAPPSGFSGLNLELEGSLESALGQRVQVVVMNNAPVDLVHRILRDGRLVFEGDHRARVAFEVKARNEYFDLLPYLERYRAPRTA
jgi:predicted nucleotidyltransferase